MNIHKNIFSNIDAIHHSKCLIIDLSDNIGGSFNFNDSIIQYLIDKDSIASFRVKTKVNALPTKQWVLLYIIIPFIKIMNIISFIMTIIMVINLKACMVIRIKIQ